MALKPPSRPEDIYDQLMADLRAVLGDDLLGLSVFGSAAQGRYVPGASDINLLVLLADGSHHRIKELIPFCQKWAPAKVAPPLVLSPGFMSTSLDVFPIEFLVMAAGHRHLLGRDPLEGLSLDRGKLRLQLERELRAKFMAIQARILTSGGQEKALRALIAEALPAFTALFQALLHLTAGLFPLEPARVMDAMAERGLDGQAFKTLAQAQAAGAGRKMGAGELMTLWEQTLAGLERIINMVDEQKTAKEPDA